MRFPDDANVSEDKRAQLKTRIGRLQVVLAQVDEQAVKGTGPGGQKMNKTQSGVLLRYELGPAFGHEKILVKWTRERQHSLNRFLALRELVDQIEMRVSPETSERLKEHAARRKQKDRARRRQAQK